MKLLAWLLVQYDVVLNKAFDWIEEKLEPLFDAMDAAEERINSKGK